MIKLIVQATFIVTIAHLFHLNAGDKHSYGVYTRQMDDNARRFFRKTVIDAVNDVEKNYTLIFKFFGSAFKDVWYFEIDVNTPSTGNVSVSRDHQVDAKIHINCVYNVTATISIFRGVPVDLVILGYPESDFYEKSFTVVYVLNATENKSLKPFYQNSFGNRQKNDEIIYFESRNVTIFNRFPSRAFTYSGDEYITYVGFSFNSPTAMALIKTTFVGENEFNSVVYDMNTEHFVANMSVYGMRGERPNGFVGLI